MPKLTMRRCSPEEFAAKVPEIHRMAQAGAAHRTIAKRFAVSEYRVLKFMRDNGLIPEDRRKNRPAHKRQTLRLAVNVVRLPDVDEADAKLARQAWREFERAEA